MKNPSAAPPTWAIVLGFALVYLSWGTTYLPTRIAIYDEHMPPLLFGGVRIFCGGLLLLVYQIARGGQVAPSSGDFGKILGVSFLLFVAGSGLMFLASATVNSGVCAVLAATTPLWLGLFAMLWPHGDRLTARGWLGLLVGLAGVLLLVGPRLASADELVRNIGVLFVLGSAAAWAFGTLILRHLRLETSHLTTAAYQLILGGAGLVATGALAGETWPGPLTPRVIQAFFYLLFFGSLVGFVAYNWLLSHVAAAKVGTYAYVNPLIAVLVGWGAGEEVTGALTAGIGVILLGVFLIRGGERPDAAALAGKADADLDAQWREAQLSEPP